MSEQKQPKYEPASLDSFLVQAQMQVAFWNGYQKAIEDMKAQGSIVMLPVKDPIKPEAANECESNK